jgi:hypothetical protein
VKLNIVEMTAQEVRGAQSGDTGAQDADSHWKLPFVVKVTICPTRDGTQRLPVTGERNA